MKKYIFLVLVTILSVLILLYLYDKKEMVLNKKYINDAIYIEYPYFNNKSIDLYIDNYLNSIINNSSGNNYFVDYDYVIDDNEIDLIMYKYIYYDNVIKNSISKYVISIGDNSIKRVNNINFNNKYINKVKGNNYKVAFLFEVESDINIDKILELFSLYNVKATFCIDKDSMYKEKLEQLGMYILYNCNIGYDIDSLDDKYHSSKMISYNVIKNIHNGDVIFMHSIYSSTVNSLENIIPNLINNGYKLVTVSSLNRL